MCSGEAIRRDEMWHKGSKREGLFSFFKTCEFILLFKMKFFIDQLDTNIQALISESYSNYHTH